MGVWNEVFQFTDMWRCMLMQFSSYNANCHILVHSTSNLGSEWRYLASIPTMIHWITASDHLHHKDTKAVNITSLIQHSCTAVFRCHVPAQSNTQQNAH